jgi:phosphatidate cytidylyltransferase
MPFVNLTGNAAVAVATIVGVLLLATVAAFVVQRRQQDEASARLIARLRAWWILACVFFVAMAISRRASVVFFAFISFLAFKEFISMIPTRRADRATLFWAYIAIPIQYLWVFLAWYPLFIVFIPVVVLLFVPIRMALAGHTSGFLRSVGSLHWGLMTTVFSLSHAAFLLMLPDEINPKAGGPGFVIFLVVLTQLNDVFVQLWGRVLGRTKIVRQSGRHKTWEGLGFGVGTTTLVALAMAQTLTPFNIWQSLVAGLIIGLAGFFGDVSITAIKRDIRLSEGGSMMHGGILDRVDSLTYTAPLFFHFTHYLFI